MRRLDLLTSCFIIIALFLTTGWAHAGIITVNSTDDTNSRDAVITLREAIVLSEGSLLYGDLTVDEQNQVVTPVGSGIADTIDFSVSGTIYPGTELPWVTDDGTVIDASSQWIGAWPDGQPGVALDGMIDTGSHWFDSRPDDQFRITPDDGWAEESDNGLLVSGADNCHIRGLSIMYFAGNGIAITEGAQSNTVGGVGAEYRNVIHGNASNGVYVWGSGTDSNIVSGNYIGTDVDGTHASGNLVNGVIIGGGAQSNTIGGASAQERNIISGNGRRGVDISGPGTNNNTVSGNYIGTDVDGIADLGNSRCGIGIWGGAQSNVIGGDATDNRNIISGNGGNGVRIVNSGTDSNIVSGNYIGTDISGTVDLGNEENGVHIHDGAQFNIVGGATANARNIISGNYENGVAIHDPGTSNNVVLGNHIGTDPTGTAAIGNTWRGVRIENEAQSNTIGGTTPEEKNLISGNHEDGVAIIGIGTDRNVVSGNYIGTDVNGTSDLGNSWNGVRICDGAQASTIGGTSADARNIISGNDECGVFIQGPGTDNNMVSGNYIGTNIDGTLALGNTLSGVAISGGAQSNTIGGRTPGKRNIISGNNEGEYTNGVAILDSETSSNVVSGNYIGTDYTGTAVLGNAYCGVGILDAQSNIIGGKIAGEGNVISGNQAGVGIGGSGAHNVISGNYIGTDPTGTADLGNWYVGVGITDAAHSNTIGGTRESERNIISGNDEVGVGSEGSGANNTVLGNYIGTDASGTDALGNDDGVYCIDSFLVIQRNVIANNRTGVRCDGIADPDLGGGSEIRRGLNAIYDNLNYNVYNGTGNIIMAEHNWWGTRRPDEDLLFGEVDYRPWLRCPAGVPLSSDPTDLDTLAAFRDNVLSQNETGQWLTDAYYNHAVELVEIFLRNPDLCGRSAAILEQLMPGIQFLIGDKKNGRDIVVTRLLVNSIQKLLADIAEEGGDGLADTLSRLSGMLDHCAGKRISRIWGSL